MIPQNWPGAELINDQRERPRLATAVGPASCIRLDTTTLLAKVRKKTPYAAAIQKRQWRRLRRSSAESVLSTRQDMKPSLKYRWRVVGTERGLVHENRIYF